MIILYGTRSFKKIMAQTGPYTCNHCGNATFFNVVRVANWFTMFFIPLFPFSFKYFHVCPVCGDGQRIDKATAKNLIEQAKNQQQQVIEIQ
jgi:hypothetical protein